MDRHNKECEYGKDNIKAVTANFHFQSFGEYRTLLELFNLTAEEVKRIHNGILYSVTDEKGNKVGRPFKSSLFGKWAGYEALQKYYETSKLAVEKTKIRESLRPIISKAMQEAKSEDDFRLRLRKKHIGVVVRKNEQGRIYGVTFIDYQNCTVINGSRLGKEFSANAFHDLFNQEHNLFEYKDEIKDITGFSNQENQKNQVNQGLDSGSIFGLLDVSPSGSNDHEEENFVREQERQRKKIQKKRGRKM
ncbi:MAG: hypothetical protein LBL07_09630 [Tannerella sp.]|jgi:hypothetical protein|nr:hypothetical protein [Tannerella sp.]